MKKVLIIALLSLLPIFCFGQNVKYDKTDANGRTIITDTDEIFDDNGEGRLGFYTFTKDGVTTYMLSLSTDEELHVHPGYKLLLKHRDGAITELTCVEEGNSLVQTVVTQNWFTINVNYLKSTSSVLYAVTEDQLRIIENNPVIKIRIEQELEYTDKDIRFFKYSVFSKAVEYGHNKIKEALAYKRAGLYDNF